MKEREMEEEQSGSVSDWTRIGHGPMDVALKFSVTLSHFFADADDLFTFRQ